MNFFERFDHILQSKNSLLCVGLDTDVEKMPASVRRQPDPLFAFNRAIIEATAPFAAAFKINTAFYEAHGVAGWQALTSTFKYLPDDVLKIADAKRGDIGNTAKMYARALFEVLGADAVTVNPLMGLDSVAPFLQDEKKGVFFLCLTSNAGAEDFQHFSDGERKLYEVIADRVASWNERRNCGLVVGATHPEELRGIRKIAPQLPLLIPGIGAQGGDLQKSVQYGAGENGRGAIYNSSRAIIYASSGEDFARAAAAAAERTRDELNEAKKNTCNCSQLC
ncbi:orotidine-5'-phosphate decarboxylase [candidate division KSB1 bacterium]|nr:orotidine-5'-phosphate decarboxylase [candidate division KSB1 bacterium]